LSFTSVRYDAVLPYQLVSSLLRRKYQEFACSISPINYFYQSETEGCHCQSEINRNMESWYSEICRW